MADKKYIQNILDISYTYNIGHIPSALSLLPILLRLQNDTFTFFCGKPYALQAYMVAWDTKYIPNTFSLDKSYEGIICGPNNNIKIAYSDPNLGNALSEAIGYSLCHMDEHIVVIVGDSVYFMGEFQEGLRLLRKFPLPITIIIDSNNVQLFGNEVVPIDTNKHISIGNKPTVYRYPTLKGFGVTAMENAPKDWHYRCLTKQEHDDFVKEC